MFLENLFKLSLFTLPFENLFFAPSSGWATITPILFFIYCLLDLKNTIKVILYKDRNIFISLYLLILYSLFLYLFNPFEVSNFVGGIQTLILGSTIYIIFVSRYIIQKKNFEYDIKLLLLSYSISFLYGVTRYIIMIFDIDIILNIFELIEKRSSQRLSFSFTEPSFISMHLFGVLLPLLFLVKSRLLKKRIIFVICLFSTLTIISKSSTRFLVDSLAVIFIITMCYIFSSKTKFVNKLFYVYGIIFILFVCFISISTNILSLDGRIGRILEKGIYADASLASRYFRINASVKGYFNSPDKALFGTGIGNSYIFLNSGYDEAKEEYRNDYMVEVDALKNSKADQLFCMHTRLISEFGLLLYITLLCYLIIYSVKNKRNIALFFIVFYLYIQFDSYGFYTFWIYMFYLKYCMTIKRQDEVMI